MWKMNAEGKKFQECHMKDFFIKNAEGIYFLGIVFGY
jgi:hypothetical protein